MAEFEWQGMRILRMPNRPGSHVRHPEGPEDLVAGIWGLSECDGGVYYCSREGDEDSVMRLEPTTEFAERLNHRTSSLLGARVVFALTRSEELIVLLYDRGFSRRDMKALASVNYRRLKPTACPPGSADVRPVDGGPPRSDIPTSARRGAI